jgi:SAM-dependent methyltransferase
VRAARLWERLRCPSCGRELERNGAQMSCGVHVFPVDGDIPRLLPPDLMRVRQTGEAVGLRGRTYRSFGFEWQSFSAQIDAYRENFRWYLEPLPDPPGASALVLDAGCGMGRHTRHFLAAGAEVLALDASPAIDVAARNNPAGEGLFVQADLLHLPVREGAFDLVCCLGVLHHIEDTEAGLAQLVRAVRPGGWVLVYLYHDPAERSAWRGALLSLVGTARRVTTRLPMGVLRTLTWLIAGCLWLGYVGPAKLLVRVRSLSGIVRSVPLGQYVDYPFRVLWNDQFDRFSAPLEKRYRRAAVEALLTRAGLEELRILGGYGWRAAGRRAVT